MLFQRADNSDVTDFHFYYYHPSMPAAIIFAILFGVVTSLHCAQMIRSRVWFMIPFLIGGIFETVGYIGRALSASQNPGPYTLPPYIVQTILLLVAPALFAASIYMELGRVVQMLDADRALFIRRKWLTKIFVGGDVLSFLLQASGAGFLSSGDVSKIETGKDIVVGGLFLQVIFFGLFVIAAALFHRRLNKQPTQQCYDLPWWKKHMLSLYIVSILIFVRSIVRVVEYLQGYSGFIMRHEMFLYVFDSTVMFLAVAAMNWIHPGEVARELREEKRGGGGQAGGAEAQRQKNGMEMDYVSV